MNSVVSKFVVIGLIFLSIFLSGFWLSHSGKPYRVVPFNLHKFIALGAVIFLAVSVNRIHRTSPLNAVEMTVVAAAALCFIATFATGGVISASKNVPAFVLRLHQIFPYVTLLFSAAGVWLLRS